MVVSECTDHPNQVLEYGMCIHSSVKQCGSWALLNNAVAGRLICSLMLQALQPATYMMRRGILAALMRVWQTVLVICFSPAQHAEGGARSGVAIRWALPHVIAIAACIVSALRSAHQENVGFRVSLLALVLTRITGKLPAQFSWHAVIFTAHWACLVDVSTGGGGISRIQHSYRGNFGCMISFVRVLST